MDLELKKKWKFLTGATALTVALLGATPGFTQTGDPLTATANPADRQTMPDFVIAPSMATNAVGSVGQHVSHESHASHASHSSHSSHTSYAG